MNFEFSTAASIIFGPGVSLKVPGLAAKQGQRVFFVTDSQERCQPFLDRLSKIGLSIVVYFIDKEPDLESVILATRKAKKSDCQSIISLGGGSTIDTGKAVAALMANPGNLLDYLEVVGAGRTLENPSIPHIAIPTTAGTGSEVTRNAVITVTEKRLKVSLRSPYLLPWIAVIDPELTFSLPPSITAATGMDAMTQLIEPFVCSSPTPLTDVLCHEGISRAVRSLRIAFENGQDANAREDMSMASLCGGMALANARLGAVHGMATPIGGMSGAPHGAVCARLLPLVMETNLLALRTRQPDSTYIARYDEIARLLTGNEKASADAGVKWINELRQALDIRPLKEYGLNSEDFPAIVEQSQKASSMRGNPIKLTDEELTNILERAV